LLDVNVTEKLLKFKDEFYNHYNSKRIPLYVFELIKRYGAEKSFTDNLSIVEIKKQCYLGTYGIATSGNVIFYNETEKVEQLISSFATKTFETETKVLQTIKSDSKEVAKRLLTQKIRTLVKSLLLTSLKQTSKKSSNQKIENFLSSSYGEVVIGTITSVVLDSVSNSLSEKQKKVLTSISQEMRIQSETLLVSNFLEVVENNMKELLTSKIMYEDVLTRIEIGQQDFQLNTKEEQKEFDYAKFDSTVTEERERK